MIDVAPAWTVARAPAVPGRSMVRALASYDGARTTVLNERAWRNADGLSAKRANSLAKRRELRNRSRYLYGNDPIVFGMFHKWANYLVGRNGPKRHVTTPDPEVNAAVEARWQEWCYASRFVDQLRVRTVAKHVDGESFGVLCTNPGIGCAVQLDVKNLECDQVTDGKWDQNGCDGIRFDEYGNPESYDIVPHHPGDAYGVGGKPRRYPARQVLHWFRVLRPGQVRGIPTMTPGLELIVVLGGFTISTARSANTAAGISVLLEEAAGQPEYGATETVQEVAANWSTQEINHDTMMKLPPGMTAKQLNALNPNERFEMFEKCILRRCAQCFPMPFCLAVGDHSDSNFSASRMDRLDFWNAIDVEREDCEREDLDPIFAAWLDEAVMIPGYLPPAIGAYMGQRLPGAWGWSGRELLSPSDEAQSDALRVEKGLASLQSVCAERGEDWREVLRQQAEVEAYKKEIGLIPAAEPAPVQPAQAHRVADVEACGGKGGTPGPCPQGGGGQKHTRESALASTNDIHERAKSDPSLTYADIDKHVESLKDLPKKDLIEVAKTVHVTAPASASKEWLLQNIGESIKNRKGRQERTKSQRVEPVEVPA